MTRNILEVETFGQLFHINDLPDRQQAGSVINWGGTAASLGLGLGGTGQAAVGPSSMNWIDVSGFYGTKKSFGVRVRWKLSTLGVTNPIIEIVTTTGSVTLQSTSSNLLQLISVPGNPVSGTSADTAVHVTEFWLAVDAANGAWRVVHDGAEIASLTATSQNTGAGSCTGVNFNNANITIDQVVLMSDSGVFTNDNFLEASSRSVGFARLFPIAAGFYNAWAIIAPNLGEASYEDVDDVTSDGNTSRLRGEGSPESSSWLWTQLDWEALEAAQFLAAKITCGIASQTLGTTMNTFIRAGGVDYPGSTAAGGAGETNGSEVILNDGGGVPKVLYRGELYKVDPISSDEFADMAPDAACDALNSYEWGIKWNGGFATTITICSVDVLYITGSTRSTGLILRGAYDAAGGITKGYVCRLDYGPFGDIDAIVSRTVSSASVDIATAVVTTGYGLAFDTNYELRASVENIDGANPATGHPAITMEIDGTLVIGWTPLIAGIDISDDDEVVDETPQAILSGTSQGMYLVPPASGSGFLYYKLWSDDFEPDPEDPPPEDEPSITMSRECTGKTGTFAAPIGSIFGVRVGSVVSQHPYETGHVNRNLRDPSQRRHWNIGLPEGMTATERDDLWEFWDEHGKSIPFDFSDPETGTLICAHFENDALATIKQAPAGHAYEVLIEELLEQDGPSVISPIPTSLTITSFAPSIGVVNPGSRAVALTRFAPVLLLRVTPTTSAKTITRFAPIIRLGVIPAPISVSITRTAPTVTGP